MGIVDPVKKREMEEETNESVRTTGNKTRLKEKRKIEIILYF